MHEGKLALGNHLYLECVWFVFSEFLELELDKVKPCTNSSFNVSLKPMTGTVGDPVINCMILETSISGTPEKKNSTLFYLQRIHGNCVTTTV